MLDEDVQVELDPADHEEDRDEEPEPDGLQFRLDRLALRAGGEQADDDAGGKRPKSTSRPSVSASSTSSTMNSSDTRTGSWHSTPDGG